MDSLFFFMTTEIVVWIILYTNETFLYIFIFLALTNGFRKHKDGGSDSECSSSPTLREL